jgi:peptidoglycan hydrolase-like protein with peptidoglycan-binding domain
MRRVVANLVLLTLGCHGIPDDGSSVTGGGGAILAWPGADDAVTVDATGLLGGNESGLVYDATEGVMWAVRNDPSNLLRLVEKNGVWGMDASATWNAGRTLKYPDNSGGPDAEGVTVTSAGAAGGIYVASERDNLASNVSRNAVLRYDVSQSGATLRATHEWNLTALLPSTGANSGIEAISWIPDSALTANAFIDENTGQAYQPATYPAHGTGLFVTGLEANGSVYVFALNHTTSTATRIASAVTGLASVMGMEYDAAAGQLWTTCDDGCANKLVVLGFGAGTTRGRLTAIQQYLPPTTLPNVNNEGFAFAPFATCVGGRRSAFWVDDSNTGEHALRRASRNCALGAR